MEIMKVAEDLKYALSRGYPCRVAVHNQAQKELAERALNRMAKQGHSVTVEVLSEEDAELIPVGTILV